ncbi:MAG TPA: peptidylprolyl isomerase [Bryobacteraceae bacterium]|nr:peptidylprolyl isomerase [Bryobacteraceae bacterium]
MVYLRYLLLVCPVICALAQTAPPASRQATPVPRSGAGGGAAAPNVRTIPIPPPLPQVPPDTVVLTVGDLKLTAAQFDAIADILPEQSKAFVKGPGRKKFADQVAKVIVLSEEARRQKLDQAADFQLQSKYRSDEWLATLEENAIRDSIKVDDATLRDFYAAHKSDYERIRGRHILIRFQGSPAPLKPGAKDLTEEEALAKARDLIQRIKGGEDFAKIAAAESDDNGAAASGGDLGWFGHGQMIPSVEEAAFKLEPGQLSEPVRSQFGYHIILVEDRQSQSFDDVKAGIEKKLHPLMTQKALDEMEGKVKIDYDPTFFGLAKQ